MNNPRISKKEQGLIKGSLRRVFSRSDLRRQVIDAAIIEHTDAKRPRVTKWCRCSECKQPTPKYLTEVDHKIPLIAVDKTLDDMTWDELLDRLWCSADNLFPICKPCHKLKSKQENKLRREFKKAKKKA